MTAGLEVDAAVARLLSWTVMALARAVFPALLTLALAAYGFDCSPTTTAERAMQCCDSMQCMRHHHQSEDCCKTMPTSRAVLGQPTSAGVSLFAPVVFETVQPVVVSMAGDSSASVIAEHSHDPPISGSFTLSPLRI